MYIAGNMFSFSFNLDYFILVFYASTIYAVNITFTQLTGALLQAELPSK